MDFGLIERKPRSLKGNHAQQRCTKEKMGLHEMKNFIANEENRLAVSGGIQIKVL